MIGLFYRVLFQIWRISCGQHLKLKGWPVIFNRRGATLSIGSNVTINSSFLSNLAGLYSRTILCTRTPEAKIAIGDHVGISGATLYARKGITIGDYTNIGVNCKILDNDFHPMDGRSRMKMTTEPHSPEIDALISAREIVIGKNCFLGCNSIILKGTVLGDGCVVGAGAVVSGTFAPGSVIVGNPGKMVKMLSAEAPVQV